MKYVIFDIDGCISDDRWRRECISRNDEGELDYTEYHKRLYSDNGMNENLVDFWVERSRNTDIKLVFIADRPISYAKKTIDWIRYYFGEFQLQLLMREKGDLRLSPEFKVAALENWKIPFNSIIAAHDDDQDVLDAYDKAGIVGVHLLNENGLAEETMVHKEQSSIDPQNSVDESKLTEIKRRLQNVKTDIEFLLTELERLS